MILKIALFALAFLLQLPISAQVSITSVVSAASWATPLEPGSVIAIFGAQLANTTTTATGYPLPRNLSGTSVTVNGLSAPLYFVSPGQINAQMPWVPEYSMPLSAAVVVTAPGGVSPSFSVPQVYVAPGVFTADASGCGQAAALNITPSGAVSMNSTSNSAQPGDYLAVFGTGFGQPVLPVTDGTPSPVRNIGGNSVAIGAASLSPPAVTYDGLAPSLVGVDQINLRIPVGAQEGCAVPLTVGGLGYQSPTVTVSVHTGRGQCVGPTPSSYGQVVLMKTAGAADTLTAIFPSGPDVQPPVPLLRNSDYNPGPALPLSRACAVPGYTNLSAGAIAIQGPAGTATALPQSQLGGVAYQADLPSGFVQAGKYTISSAPNQPASFSAVVQVDPPIQLQTTFAPGAILSAGKGFTIQWTGGNPSDIIRVELVNLNAVTGNLFNTYVTTVGAGSITLQGTCMTSNPINGLFCSWNIPDGSARLIIDVLPPGGIAATSGATQLSWDYRFIFDSLVLGN